MNEMNDKQQVTPRKSKKGWIFAVIGLFLVVGLTVAAQSRAGGGWGGCRGGGPGGGPGYGPQMMQGGYGMQQGGYGMHRGGYGMHRGGFGMQQHLTGLKEVLQLTPNQETAWKTLEAAMEEQHAARQGMWDSRSEARDGSHIEWMESRLAMKEGMLAGQRKVIAAWKGLEEVLTDAQKKALTAFSPRQRCAGRV